MSVTGTPCHTVEERERVDKRKYLSPEQAEAEKRLCFSDSPSSVTSSDFECTEIYDPRYLSSTMIEADKPHAGMSNLTSYAAAATAAIKLTSSESSSPATSGLPNDLREALRVELRAILFDPVVLDVQSKAIAAELHKEIVVLKKQLTDLHGKIKARDEKIFALEKKCDDMEQYSRQNNMRITGIPESKDENTESVVLTIAEAMGATLDGTKIERCHRVGPKKDDGAHRVIIVRFVSWKSKSELMRCKKNLAKIKCEGLFPTLDWPLPLPGTNRQGKPFAHRIYLNEDLTKGRATAAAKARRMVKSGQLKEVWIGGGSVHVRDKAGAAFIINSVSELDRLVAVSD